MNGRRILFVEDDPGLARTVGDLLRAEGCRVQHVSDGERALHDARETPAFDLILLDVMLPGIDGFEVCRQLRRGGIDSPIMMLTARGEVRDRVAGLRLGADDYLVKPFDPAELLARMEALLRRTSPDRAPSPRVQLGDVEVDLRAMEVTRDGALVELSWMEYQLLVYLLDHRGTALSRKQILRDVWGYAQAPRTRTVDVHITWLRSKLESDRSQPRWIKTVRGVGYMLTTETQ